MSGPGRTIPTTRTGRPNSRGRASPSGVSRPAATTGPRASGRATPGGGARGRPPAGAPVAHLRRLDRGRGPRAARRVVLRRARAPPPGGRREIRVRARSVRPARRLRGGLGRGTGDLSRRDRGDRGGRRRVHRPARGPRGGPHALGRGGDRGPGPRRTSPRATRRALGTE